MAYAQSIADIIRQEAQQRGQIGVAKAGLWPQAIGQSAEGLQGALNQIAQNRTRGLQDTALKQRIAAGDIDLSRAKREEEYNKRKEAAQKDAQQRATQATSQDEKLRILTEFAQQWEPKAYREMVEEARKQRESDVNIEKTKAETERARRPAPKQLISPGAGVLNDEGTGASYTQPFKEVDPRESTAGTGRYMDVDKGQGLRRYQFNTETGRYDIDTGTPPPSVTSGGMRSAPNTQLTTITTPDGPKLVEYSPGKGGKGSIRIIEEGAVKGTVPAVSESAQKEIAGIGTAANSLNQLKTLLPAVKTGPLWGRLRSVKVNALGGWGTSPEEVKVVTKINTLMRSAFNTAGANFTEPEMRIFRSIFPGENDTLETALTKIDESLNFLDDTLKLRKGTMTPMQRSQTTLPAVKSKEDLRTKYNY